MVSAVSFLPHQPLCVSSISKGGQLLLHDIRLLGRPLLQQQLEGPVFDALWTQGGPAAAAAAAGGGGAAAAAAGGSNGGSSSSELQLCVAGRDNCLRVYSLTVAALQQGEGEG